MASTMFPLPGDRYAYLDLEPGLNVSHVSCFYDDRSAVENIEFALWRFRLNMATGESTVTGLASGVSSGEPGSTFLQLILPADSRTIHKHDNVRVIQDQITVRLGANTSFSGCMAYWHRQVAPAPATATFNDVPTNSPFFKFVEALNESGVSSGCGNGNYCPNAPVTRAQMAVFLAEALGMGYPY